MSSVKNEGFYFSYFFFQKVKFDFYFLCITGVLSLFQALYFKLI